MTVEILKVKVERKEPEGWVRTNLFFVYSITLFVCLHRRNVVNDQRAPRIRKTCPKLIHYLLSSPSKSLVQFKHWKSRFLTLIFHPRYWLFSSGHQLPPSLHGSVCLRHRPHTTHYHRGAPPRRLRPLTLSHRWGYRSHLTEFHCLFEYS